MEERQAAPWRRGRSRGVVPGAGAKRNPVVVASRSNLVLVEFDGDFIELAARYGLWALPGGTVRVRSRRGLHLYYRPPAGCAPMKIQVAASGYHRRRRRLLGRRRSAPSVRPHLQVRLVTGITEMPAETYHLFRRLHDQTKAELREKIARGEPIDEGNRHDVVYIEPLKALYAGATDEQALERALEVNQTFDEPYPKKTVRRHWLRAVRWAAAHASPEQLATAKARAILNGQRPAPVTPSATRKGKRVLLRSRSAASALDGSAWSSPASSRSGR